MAEEDKTDNKDNGEGEGKGSDQKMVPESDLIAVKMQLDPLKVKVTEAETQAVEWQTKFNAATASGKTSSTELESLKTVQVELDKLKEKSEGDSKLLTTATEALVTKSRELILTRYPKIASAKLENKSLEQLDMLLETLEDVAPGDRKPNDPGPGGGSNGKTPLDIAADEMAAAKAK